MKLSAERTSSQNGKGASLDGERVWNNRRKGPDQKGDVGRSRVSEVGDKDGTREKLSEK